MQKTYLLKGLDCPDCARRLEDSVKKISYINVASVNLIKNSLEIDVDDSCSDNILNDLKEACQKHDVEIIEALSTSTQPLKDDDDEKKERTLKVLQLSAGAIVFIISFFMKGNIKTYLLLLSYVILGLEIVIKAVKNIFKLELLDENFLMSIASIGAIFIGEYPEAVAVMLFYQIGEFFQESAVSKSKRSISGLMDIRPDYANIKRNNEVIKVSPYDVKEGDIIIIKPGEKVPLDGIVIDGSSSLDTKALTGESMPKDITRGETILSGSINISGMLTVEVTKEFTESTVSKILDLAMNASSKKAKAENFITTFSKYYTPIVVLLAVLLASIPPLFFGGIFTEWLRKSLVFLVISCPCALVISVPLSFFAGIGRASKSGILVKGSNYLEALTKLEVIVFDKTGTLTTGNLKVTKVAPANNITEEELMKIAAHAESFSNHPIAASIKLEYKDLDEKELSDYEEIPGYGICVKFEDKETLAGNDKLMEKYNIDYSISNDVGTKIYIASGGVFAGYILINDTLKPDSKPALKKLKSFGIRKTVMLTGDNKEVAEVFGKELGIDEFHAGLLPDEKVFKVEELISKKTKNSTLAFVGDGINDAPVLKISDIGIAMGGLGSDAAIEAADIVLMTDEPSKLITAIEIARKTKRIVWQNIIFALGIKIIFLTLGAFGIATMWEAVFADVGVSLIAILNSLRVLR